MNLEKIGWNNSLEEAYKTNFKEFTEKGCSVGRVFAEHTHLYKLYTETGEILGEVSGKMRYEALEQQDFPAVGDWVVISERPEEARATIHGVLPRKSKFSRKVAGTNTKEQLLATNIDTVFLVNALNNNYNVRRLERYLILAWESGANPVIVLSKADLCDDVEEKLAELEGVAPGVPVLVISALENRGMDELKEYVKAGSTVALLGSSGVGKSTVVNHLMGYEVMKTKEIRESDQEGKHTSSHREIFILPEGGLIIDTPGMREIQIWSSGEGFAGTFEDIETLASQCTFRDCKHAKEPGCAIKAAIHDGALDSDRLENYRKLQKELKHLENKQNQVARLVEKKKSKIKSKHGKPKVYSYDYE